MRKRHFALGATRLLALVRFIEGIEPEMFLIPATAWLELASPFSPRDYPGLKSEPEYGLSLAPAAMRRLQAFRFKVKLDALAARSPAPDAP